MASGFAFRECFAEFMGVFALVFFGGWATVLVVNEKIDLQSVALVHSFSIGIFMWVGGSFSNCHFNPAISLAFFAVKKIDAIKLLFYVISQFIGSYIGALLIYYTLPETLYTVAYDKNAELGCPHLNNSFKAINGFIMETVGAFIVTFVFACLADQDKTPHYSLVIGFATGLSYLSIGELSGASANPFRYFGPALLSTYLWDSYIYLIVPFLGSLLAVAVYEYIFALSDSEKAEQNKYYKTKKSRKIE